MTSYLVRFSRSDAVVARMGELADHEVLCEEFVQLTYEGLRIGPDGKHIAHLGADALWYLEGQPELESGPYSDVVIAVAP